MDGIRMVQDHLLAQCGVPFLHGWPTLLKVPESKKHNPEPGDFTMTMEITSYSGDVTVFEHGKGLTDGHSRAGMLVVVCAIHDPCNLGVGEYSYEVNAFDRANINVLHATGSLVVSPADDNQKPSGALPTNFDFYTPQGVITGDVDALPEPEVPDEVYRARLDICSNCPAFSSEGVCNECGCFMPVKAGLTSASCPIHKWGEYVEG